jgi:hypothetical protein
MLRSLEKRESMGTRRIATVVERLCVVLVFAAVFAFHARWILAHFSNDGYLCDSGWLAFLFENNDPLLRNPRSVVGNACAGFNASTFLAHHLSPHIFVFGAPLSVFRVSGIYILGYHQGLFFGLFFVAAYLVIATARLRTGDRLVALLAAVLVGTLGNALLQAAAYPHYETALFALSSLALATCLGRRWFLFAGCLAWLPFVREDGGLYAAVVCFSCLAVEYGEERRVGPRASTLAIAAGLELVVSATAFLVKANYFPGFDAYSKNFAGDHWDHVTRAFLVERAYATLINWNIAPVLAGSVVLTVIDQRYITGIVLLAPLFLVHMLSARPEHGHFTLYYALPWLLPVVIWLAVLVRRMGASRASIIEKAILVILSSVLTAPVQAIIGTPQQRWDVAQQALTRPVVNVAAMKELARWVRATFAASAAERGQKQCASMGIAALIPDDLTPEEVIDDRSDLATCRTVLLLRYDMHYHALSIKAEALGFKRVATKENADVWMKEQ